MHLRSAWIFGVSGIAIMALIACGDGQWAKEPLPTCDEGTEGCGKSNTPTKPSKSKTPTGTPIPASENTGDEGDDDGTPPVSNTQSNNDAGGSSSGSTPPKDAGPPPKGANCFSNANTCVAVTLKCGCPEDCCAGTVCAQVGGLVQNTCCKISAAPCTSHSECCGQLLCKPNAAGTGSSCQ